MSDASQLKDLLFSSLPTINDNSYWRQTVFCGAALGLGLHAAYQGAVAVIPMQARDFHRLDAAIIALANDRHSDADQIWRKVYFKLNIKDVSGLKASHVGEVSAIILDELGRQK